MTFYTPNYIRFFTFMLSITLGLTAFSQNTFQKSYEQFTGFRAVDVVDIPTGYELTLKSNIENNAPLFAQGFTCPDGAYAFAGFKEENGSFLERSPVFIKTNELGEIMEAMPPVDGFENTFYENYTDFTNLEGKKLIVTPDDYFLINQENSTANYQVFEIAPDGAIIDEGAFIDLPEMDNSSLNFNSIPLSGGGFIVATENSNFPQTPSMFFNQYDNQGGLIHSFQIDFPDNAVALAAANFEELEDGTIFIVSGYAEAALGPPQNSMLVIAQYDPISQNIIQQNTIPWSVSNWDIRIERLVASKDGNVFVHIFQNNVVSAHYISKLSLDGQELWRIQLATLERPVVDMVANEDGGLWEWNDFFSTITRYNADGTPAFASVSYNNSPENIFVRGIAPAPDNGLAVIASGDLFDSNYLITAIYDANGEVLIENHYEQFRGLNFNAEGFATPDGGYAFTGSVNNASFEETPVFIKTNELNQIISVSAPGPDLSLSMTGSNSNPPIFTPHNVTLTVSNEGTETATGIMISIPTAEGEVYTGGNEFSSSQGDFSPYGNKKWSVGSLEAGASATITINYFKIASNPFFQYAEVSAMNETDIDSTPDNGDGNSANEDDEAIYPNNTSPIDQADLTLSNLAGANTASSGTILEYTFTLSNIGNVNANGDFNIRAYFSTDNELSPDDIFDGLIPTGNIGAGQVINNVLGASTVPNLPTGDYFLILKVDADEDIDESNENNNIIRKMIRIEEMGTPGDYCEIESDFPWHEWISRVVIDNQVSNESGKSVYSDFTNLSSIANIERGQLFFLDFDITYSYQTYETFIFYYTDLNQNGIFELEERNIVSISGTPSGNNVVATITGAKFVPEDAILGPTRMRLIATRSSNVNPCTDIAFGEIEDYIVNVVPGSGIQTRFQQWDHKNIEVFPNPVNTQLNIKIPAELPAQSIQIFDAYGILKYSMEIDAQASASSADICINTSDLINGIYFVQINGNSFKPRTRRISIQRTY